MSDNMPEATRRNYRYNLRTLLIRAGLLDKSQGLESFDFRYLLGSPENVEKVRQVLETVLSRHPATGHMMLSALQHVLSIIPRRVFLVSDDLAMEWTSLVNIVSETLKYEEVKARPEQRSIRVTKAAERQTELENDIGTERRVAARRRAHEWMRRTIRTIQANEEHVAADASVAATFRQVLCISVSVLHGQRTQVYSELTVDEFSKATRHPNGSRSAMRLAGRGRKVRPSDRHLPSPGG